MNEEPPLADLRLDLAGPTYPMLLFPCVLVAPQSIDVHDCKGAILLIGDLDADRSPSVVHQFVLRKQ
jgi:hypothetical protein